MAYIELYLELLRKAKSSYDENVTDQLTTHFPCLVWRVAPALLCRL